MCSSRKFPWWRHQMETFSALLAICAGNSPVPCEFPTQGPVTHNFDVYFDLRPNKRLSKQSWGWWFETQSPPLWRHRNATICQCWFMLWHGNEQAMGYYTWTSVNLVHWSVYVSPATSILTDNVLIHWSQDKMTAISKKNQLTLLQWISFNFRHNFTEICFSWPNWQYGNVGSDNGLEPNRQQAIIGSNVVTLYWRIYTSPDLNELNI